LLELDLWIEGQKEWERQKSLRLQIERDEQMALELERQFALELERQRALEREHQAELERQRQAEIARQEREERQRQAEIARQQREERQRQAEIARQQREERQRQAEIARQQREEQELRERELRRLQDALVRQVGAQVEVRRVYGASLLSPGGAVTDQLSSAILTQLSHVKQNFAKNLPIKKIEYILNDALYKIFNNTKAELRKHKKNTKEVLLFHGTSPNNVDR
jgi:multidrug efflux pump subunit AcrA (membrane-fusion protein)